MPDLGAQSTSRAPGRPSMEPIAQSFKQVFPGGQSRKREGSLPESGPFNSQLVGAPKKIMITHNNYDSRVQAMIRKALFHIPALFNYLMSGAHGEPCSRSGQCLICHLIQTLKATLKPSCIRPVDIYNRLKLICKHLMQGRQEDAHELLRYLIDALRNSYLLSVNASTMNLDLASKETTPFNQIFGGCFRQEVKCLKCKHVSTTFQHFMDILVDIQNVSNINEAVSAFFQLERIGNAEDPGSMYTCTKCKVKGIVTKKIYIDRAPVVLCIQLKRFSLIEGKIVKPVSLAPKIDISPYVWSSHNQEEASSSLKPLEYKLVSMITHVGSSPNCGHYTAIGSASNGQFHLFDDNSVTPITLEHALNTASYVIFYEMTQTTKSIWIDNNINHKKSLLLRPSLLYKPTSKSEDTGVKTSLLKNSAPKNGAESNGMSNGVHNSSSNVRMFLPKPYALVPYGYDDDDEDDI